MVAIPVFCPHCGNVFASRMIAIQGNVRNLTLSNNRETCPRCGHLANMVNGVFNVADDVLEDIKAAAFHPDTLRRFATLLVRAQSEDTKEQDIEAEASSIDSRLGPIAKKIAVAKALGPIGLLFIVILAALQSCDFKIDATVDINRLVDQAIGNVETSEQPDLRGDRREPHQHETNINTTGKSIGHERKRSRPMLKDSPSRRRRDVNKARRLELLARRRAFKPRKSS